MLRTRIAMVGAGFVARRHAATLATFDDVLLVGVTDPRGDASRALAEEARMPAFPGLAELLDATGPDAVYVCVPPFAHGPPEQRLIERGIPFFVEKPLGRDVAVADGLAGDIAARGLLTATGYHWRYLDGLEQVRELLAATPAHLAIGAWLDKVPPPGWWPQRALSGGQVVEQVTHVLDLMVHLLGDVDEVYAIAARVERGDLPAADIDAVTAATLRFAGGAVGSLAATSLMRSLSRAGLELFCDGRRLEASGHGLVIDDGDRGGPRVRPDRGEAKRRADRAFVDAVQGRGDDVRAPYDAALRTHRVACAIARSAQEGAPVELTAAA